MTYAISLLRERLRRAMGLSDGREKGQVLIIVSLGIFVLLILVGLAVDLGLYYIERVRITRAVDAATLAAAYELPMEGAARLQALDFLLQNGYDAVGSGTAVIIDGVTEIAPSSGITKTTIWVDTAVFQDPPGSSDTAYRVQVQVLQAVPVIFLRFAGFENISCYASATAENINNLDVVVVFDKSGSMEFDTICYGCWVSDGAGYPSGTLYPLPWDGPANGMPQHCDQTKLPYQTDGRDYYFIEAEEYSYASNTYNRDVYSIGYTYWALQRRPNSASARWRSVDGKGAYIMHMPFPDTEVGSGGGVTCRYEQLLVDVSEPPDGIADFTCWSGASGGPYDAPRVDYYFAPKYDGDFYIWVRGQAAGTWDRGDDLDRRLFWGIDGVLGAGQASTNCGGGQLGCETGFPEGTGYNGARNDRWQWRRLNDTAYHWSAGENHTLNIWAGGAEFALDRIVITTNPGNYGDLTPLQEHSGRGRYVWADGRSGWACNPCDPRFAGYPADHPDRPPGFDPAAWIDKHPVCDSGPVESRDRRADYIYDDEQPVRASIESVKMFVDELLDPAFDQIGYVRYSSSSTIASELECLRRLGKDACTEDVIQNTVVTQVDATTAGGTTNIAGGMEDGLEVLRTGPRDACEDGSGPCGRPGATHVMIVMTDGQANVSPNSTCYSDPDRQWIDADGDYGTRAQDCVIYYAYEARDRNVIVFTITLGGSADFELMTAAAELTGGIHRNADRPEKLSDIFAELYDLMYLRLVE